MSTTIMSIMNSSAFFCILTLFLAYPPEVLSVNDDEEALKRAYPWAVIQTDTVDLGVLRQGSTARNYITVRNEGRYDLLIAGVRSSCGLMIPNWPTNPIKKNNEAVIHFRYNASRLGPFERKITIHTNAYQKTLIVTVTGKVVPAE
jgi:hypothetical protein